MNREVLDVDNLSKPIIDAFSGIIYVDDNSINHRICTKIKLEALDISELDLTCLPDEVMEKIIELFDNGCDDILYFEVGLFDSNMVKFGGKQA